jgi:hypothetical protein
MIRSHVVAFALASVFAVADAAADDPPADLDASSQVVVLRGTSVGGPIPPPQPAREEKSESTAVAAAPQVVVLWTPVFLDRPVAYPAWNSFHWGRVRKHAPVGRFPRRHHRDFTGAVSVRSGNWTTLPGSSRPSRSRVRGSR